MQTASNTVQSFSKKMRYCSHQAAYSFNCISHHKQEKLLFTFLKLSLTEVFLLHISVISATAASITPENTFFYYTCSSNLTDAYLLVQL